MRESKERYGGKHKALDDPLSKASKDTNIGQKRSVGDPSGRNKRSVWQVPTTPYPGAHFATFPEDLIIPCIKAGTSEEGCCPECGAPWERVIEKETKYIGNSAKAGRTPEEINASGKWSEFQEGNVGLKSGPVTESKTVGWRPGCNCGTEHPIPQQEIDADPTLLDNFEIEPHEAVPCIVLDPFMGSGTTGLVAVKLGRQFVGIDLSEEYCKMARKRIKNSVGLLLSAGKEGEDATD